MIYPETSERRQKEHGRAVREQQQQESTGEPALAFEYNCSTGISCKLPAETAACVSQSAVRREAEPIQLRPPPTMMGSAVPRSCSPLMRSAKIDQSSRGYSGFDDRDGCIYFRQRIQGDEAHAFQHIDTPKPDI